jgi:hypothetical protein
MVVHGRPISTSQANEVIVRMADPYWLMGNDKQWERLTHEAFGITTIDRHGLENYQAYDLECKRVHRELGTVHAGYLGLAGRIYTSMISGPYGWCDWDGTIRGAYNVGKWPSVAELDEQWHSVASAFSFLSLTVQIFDKESCELEGDESPVAQWTISDGVARFDDEPGPSLLPTLDPEATKIDESWFRRFNTPGFERGVSIDRLRAAVAQVRETYVPEDAHGDERE